MRRVRGLTVPKERTVQRQIVAGLRALGLRCIAIPNGGKLSGATPEVRARQAIARRRDGEVAGFPDLLVYRPRSPIWGLLEVKREGVSLSGEHIARQLDCHAALRSDGQRVAIVRSLDDAVETVTGWGMLQPQEKAA